MVLKKFTFAISSADEFLLIFRITLRIFVMGGFRNFKFDRQANQNKC